MAMPKSLVVSYVVLSLLAVVTLTAWYFVHEREPADLSAEFGPARPARETAALLTYEPVPIGAAEEAQPMITHVAVADLDADGLLDVLACDAASDRVVWIRQAPRGTFAETVLGGRVVAPMKAVVGDFTGDGRLDVAVASAGSLESSNDRVGRVVLLENAGDSAFQHRTLAENLLRVSDLRAIDFNGDQRLDLLVGERGSDRGEVSWLENQGEGRFARRSLATPGALAGVVSGDFDGDKQNDVAALMTAPEEGIWLRRTAAGTTSASRVWQPENGPWGGSGLELCDLNSDGHFDLLSSNGWLPGEPLAEPSPSHGLQWLENRDGALVVHPIGKLAGCTSPLAVDLDGDGDLDLVAGAGGDHVIDVTAVWLMGWLNDGQQNFTPAVLARDPVRLAAVAAGDLDGNGTPVLVTGAYHERSPLLRLSRVTLWRRVSPSSAP